MIQRAGWPGAAAPMRLATGPQAADQDPADSARQGLIAAQRPR